MKLTKPASLLKLTGGEIVSKRNLFDLIQYSKVEGSDYWEGQEYIIGNTPQQGINWVGVYPSPYAVIIKTRGGAYKLEGWLDSDEITFKYSFKARNGAVNVEEKANQVLIKQPEYGYPILLFIEHKKAWRYEGEFVVNAIEEEFVVLRRKDIRKSIKSTKNSAWKRDELILALDLYFRVPEARGNEGHSSVLELSKVLNELRINSYINFDETFRNANGVGMKLRNFLAYDPEYKGKALSRGSKLEEEIWDAYSTNINELNKVADAIRINYSSGELSEVTNLQTDMVEEASEGEILTKIHVVRERNRKIVEIKKNKVMAETGRLACEACGFDFQKKYGDLGAGFAECHHEKPVSELIPGDKTKLEDLRIVCANCHRMIHRKRPWKSVAEISGILQELH